MQNFKNECETIKTAGGYVFYKVKVIKVDQFFDRRIIKGKVNTKDL